jgi:hypothetical protein
MKKPRTVKVGPLKIRFIANGVTLAEAKAMSKRHERGCPGIQAWDVPGACTCVKV